MEDVWTVVRDERLALIADLEPLTDEQWDTPSLCPGWTVHDVVAHIVDTAKTTRLNFITGFVAARFDFDRQNNNGIARERGATPKETLARFRAVAHRITTPPAPLDTRLVEAIVHGEDIRRPLGVTHEYPIDAVARALRLQAKTKVSFGGAKEHVADLALIAEDADISIGNGPAVRGPALSLLLAVSGRTVALAELEGPGKQELVRRLEA